MRVNKCCAARGHALAVWHRLAPSALAHARAPLGGQARSARAQHHNDYLLFIFFHPSVACAVLYCLLWDFLEERNTTQMT